MKHLFRLMLLFGALLGLFGGQVAVAASVPTTIAPAAVSRMGDDCMQLMHDPRPQPGKKPCDGTLGCMIAMGCIAPMALYIPPVAFVDRVCDSKLAFWSTSSVLVGTDRPPEHHPPTILG